MPLKEAFAFKGFCCNINLKGATTAAGRKNTRAGGGGEKII
jgi:hypothetical protein